MTAKIEECNAYRLRIQQVISLLRKNSAVASASCNMLENDANALLAVVRESQGWSTIELPNICTLGLVEQGKGSTPRKQK